MAKSYSLNILIGINMKTLLLTMLLIAAGMAQVPSKALCFSHSDTAVFSFTNSGSLVLKNTPVREKSATPIAARGLVISKNISNKLWTKSDSVNISGNVLTVSSEPGLQFHNNSKNTNVLLSDSGNLVVANDDANLTHDDLYLDNHVIETDLENNVKKEYCGFGDGRIEYDSSGTSDRFYLKDHLGSTRAVIDGDGALIEAVSYDAYGAIIRSQIFAGAEEPTKEKFTGKEYDTSGYIAGGIASGLQLDYFWARYYDPEIGVWTAADPQNQYVNPYAYCGLNPIITVDPDGKMGWFAHLIIGNLTGHSYHADQPDWYRSGNPLVHKWKFGTSSDKIDLRIEISSRMHGLTNQSEYEKWVDEMESSGTWEQAGLTKEEWDAWKLHARMDLHNYQKSNEQKAYSPIESAIQFRLGSEALEVYQDAEEFLCLLFPGGLLDYGISVGNQWYEEDPQGFYATMKNVSESASKIEAQTEETIKKLEKIGKTEPWPGSGPNPGKNPPGKIKIGGGL